MKELKFRIWAEQLQEMNYQEMNYDGFRSLVRGDGTGYAQKLFLASENVMLYTGVKDKRSQEIYEGDIIRLPNSDICEVKYIETRFEAIPLESKFKITSYVYWHYNCEVIGNIYKHPDIQSG